MRRPLIIALSMIIVVSLSIFCYCRFTERKEIKNINVQYPHIIGSHIEFGSAADNIVTLNPYNDKYNTLLFAVTATCEKCYTKLNQLHALVSNDKKYSDVNILVVVFGSYDNEKITDLLNLYEFNYVEDKTDEILSRNRYFSVNQVYVLDSNNRVLLLGDLFSDDKTITRIFAKHLTA